MRGMRILIAALCLGVLLTGCGGRMRESHTPLGRSALAVAKPVPIEAPTGCGTSQAAGTTEASLKFDRLDRTYRLTVPPQADGSTPLPLVLNFHGLGSNARQEALYTGIDAAADAHGFIAVTPDGTGEPRRWNLTRNGAVDDAGFVRALIDAVSSELCVDSQRVYAMGISDGAFFSSTLACDLNDRLAAVAVVAGEPFVAARCAGKQAMPYLAFHGTADGLVPFEGGIGTRFAIPLRGVRDNMKDWAKFDGCAPDLQTQRIALDVVIESYGGCRDGSEVTLYVIENGGHVWPGAREVRPLGRTTQSIDATELILRFFEGHAKR
jgi:polyhydroxybutyrate depolymerase